MIIDCASCQAPDAACGNCVVTVLLSAPTELGLAERVALGVLAEAGLVPPLRLHPATADDTPGDTPGATPGDTPGAPTGNSPDVTRDTPGIHPKAV